jgi:predicted nucleic acid-binding protein
MGALTSRLAGYPLIGLDTSIFIYQFEAHLIYQPLAHELLTGIENGKWLAITSVISLLEINVQPLSLGRQEAARQYEALLVNFPNLKIVDIDRDITRSAAQLRALYRLGPANALQLSACIYHGAKVFITNERQLTRLSPTAEIAVLDDYR